MLADRLALTRGGTCLLGFYDPAVGEGGGRGLLFFSAPLRDRTPVLNQGGGARCETV